MTAYTDSDEEELSDAEEGDDEEPANKLAVFLNKIDSLHHGTQSEKQEGLSILLEQKEKVYWSFMIILSPVILYRLCFLHTETRLKKQKQQLLFL